MKPDPEFLISAGAWTLTNSLGAVLLIAFLLLLSVTLSRSLSPGFRALLWGLVALRLVLPFAPPSTLSIFNLSPVPVVALPASAPLASTAAPARVADMAAAAPTLAASISEPASVASMDWTLALALIWAPGVLAILMIALWRQWQAARVIRALPPVSDPTIRRIFEACREQLGIRSELALVAAPPGSGIAVFGGVRATHVILPADLADRFAPSEIAGILRHELAHVRRNDLLWNWVVLILQSVHWFNPLVWIAGRRFQADREELCDRAALAGLPASARREYGAALIKALDFRRAPALCPALVPLISRKSEVQQRLTMIIKPRSGNITIQGAAAAACALIAIGTFTSATADERPPSRQNPRDEAPEGSPQNDRSPGTRGELHVTVHRDGVVMEGRKYTTMAEFRAAITHVDNLTPVLVSAHPDTPFQTVNSVLDATQASGLTRVALAPAGDAGMRPGPRDGEGAPRIGPRDGEGAPRTGPREGEGAPRPGPRDGEGAPRIGPRDGEGVPRTGPRDGEGVPRTGPRDGEGAPRTGPRDGEGTPRIAPRDGEGTPRIAPRDGEGTPRPGPRDGEGAPRTGPRDGEGAPRTGPRDGEGAPRIGPRDGEGVPRTGPRDGEEAAVREGETGAADDRQIAQWNRIYRAYDKNGDQRVTFEEWQAMKNGEMPADREARERGWFNQADSNSDSSLTVGEWIDWQSQRGRSDG